MYFPPTPYWTLASRAVAGDTDHARWKLDLVELAVENADEPAVMGGVLGLAPCISVARVPMRRPLWLDVYVTEAGDEDLLVFEDESDAMAWAEELVRDLSDEFTECGVTLPGWPGSVPETSG